MAKTPRPFNEHAVLNKGMISGCTRTKSGVPLDHYESILSTHPAIHHFCTCRYIHTPMHLFIGSSISRLSRRVSHIHSNISVHFQLRPSTIIHPRAHMSLFYTSIHLSIHPSGSIASFPHTSVWMLDGVQSSLSLAFSLPNSEMIDLSLCSFFFFDRWIL